VADATRLPALVLNRALLTRAYGRRYLDDYRRLAVAFDHRPETVFASVWQRAAAELGATVTGTWPTLEFRLGNARARVDGWDTHLDPPEAQRRADDKPFVVDRLGEVGLGVPEQHAFSLRSTGAALRHVRGGHGHWVVKPRSSAAGQGVTCGVRTPAELARALVAAGVFGSEFLLERQVEGSGYRFLVLDGELLDVVRRDPSSVEADGASTLRALIRAENVARVEAGGSRGSQLIHLDHDLLLALRSQGLDLETVPPAGTRTRVKQSNADAGRLDTHPVPLASVSAELVDDVKRAVSALGLRLAGVDVLTPDLGRGIAAAGGAILEVNTPAGLHFHSLTAGAPTGGHVATRILQRLLTS
jgi:D-alanine-D-alanine ligase-like ATP-grasp enzyme